MLTRSSRGGRRGRESQGGAMKREEFEWIIRGLAAADFAHETRKASGFMSEAEDRDYQEKRDAVIRDVDGRRGKLDVTYDLFRIALKDGAECPTLFALRNQMHPDDPDSGRVNDDLRSIGCFSLTSRRTDRETT